MGWASGFRAGSELGESIVDTYRSARRNRDIKEIEAGLQRQQGDATAEQETQQANIQVMAGQQPGQLQQQQLARNVGLAPAINPQQSMVAPPGQQLAGRATNVPAMGQMSPVGSEAMGLGPAARGPMSEAMEERERARQLRSLGYLDEANQALDRSLQLQAIDEERKRYGIDQEYRARAEGRDIKELDLKEAREELQNKLTNQQVDLNEFKLTQIKDMNAAYDAFASHTGDFGSFMQTDAWSKLGQRERNALVEGQTGLATNLQNLSTLTIERELSKATDLKSTVAAANKLSATDGIDVRFAVDDKTGEVTLSSVYNDHLADNYMQEQGKPIKFKSEQEAIRHIGEMAKDPIMAADNFITRQKEAATVVAAARQQGIENMEGFVDARVSVIEAMLGDYGTYADLNEADRLAFDKKVVEIMTPLLAVMGVGEEDMGGLANPSSNLTTGSPPSVEDIVPSVDDIVQDAVNRPRTSDA